MLRSLPPLGLLGWLAACSPGDGLEPLQYCEDVPAELPTSPVDTTPTWTRDMEPLLGVRCGGCHAEGELAPFPLQTWEDYVARADAVRTAVITGSMPPWSAEACCGQEYSTQRSLPQEELDQVVAWLDAGMPLGDPEDEPAEPPEERGGALPRVDVEVGMAEAYTPEPRYGNDDIRCFLVPLPEEARGTMAVGSRVIPGNRELVHHVALALVEGAALRELERLDAASEGPGWDCYGELGAPTSGNLGGFVPGQEGLELPEGYGMPIGEQAALLINMHYDTSARPEDPTDQTRVQLMLDASVDQEIRGIAIIHPLWLFDQGMKLEGDGATTSYGIQWDPQVVYGRGRTWEVWGVLLHMHELGTAGSVAILRQDGSQECLLHIEDWDFDWQADYWLTEPVRLQAGDKVYAQCSWTNPGEELAWETDQEMCAALLYAAEVVE